MKSQVTDSSQILSVHTYCSTEYKLISLTLIFHTKIVNKRNCFDTVLT